MDGSSQATADSGPARSAARAAPRRRWLAPAVGVAAVVALAAGIAVWAGLGRSDRENPSSGKTARAVREPLLVSITESGEVDAKRSTIVRNEVEGMSTVVWVIEEGTLVKEGDELVRLDSADLEEKLRSQEMTYKTAKAAFEKADKAYLISQSNRESQLATAALDIKFSRLDLQKYLGTQLAEYVIEREGKVAFADLLDNSDLGGEALQQKRKLESDIDLADEELQRAEDKVVWTRRLHERGYVTGNELKADELAVKRRQAELDQARTARDLFHKYTFPKEAEKYYRDWLEYKREYDRVDARTQSELDSAKADLDNKQEALRLEETRLENAREQLAATTITAPQPGMVVYYTERGHRWGSSESLEAGSTIHHQQALIKLPDLSEMNVEVRLHESVVKQVSIGDAAVVRMDALPDRRLTGTVTKIAVMPDRTNWWLNPGLKTYASEVTLDETPEGLKPGMNAQVEILIDRRDDVLQVPISAVHVEKGFQVVYVQTPEGVETRRVTVGLSNQQRVEITDGLAEGELVYLYRPPHAPALKAPAGEQAPEGAVAEFPTDAGRPGKRTGGQGDATGPQHKAQGMPDLQNLTPEQIKKMREHLQTLPADQRRRILERMQQRPPAQPADASPLNTGKPDDRPPEKGPRPKAGNSSPKEPGHAS